MAIYCDPACAPSGVTAVPPIGCEPVIRNKAIKRIVFIRCDKDRETILPPEPAADIIVALAALYAAGVASSAFVSPTGLTTGSEQAEPTEVPLDDCGLSTYVDGSYTLTLQFKYGWDVTPVAVSPAVDEFPEDVFWKAISNSGTQWNFGFVTCDGDLGYYMNKAETDFATGVIRVRDLPPEDINGCLKLSAKEAVITFKCGATAKRIATLIDPEFDELAAWA